MSKPESLQDLYTHELKDLWSANDQMQRVIQKIAEKSSYPKLKQLLANSQQGITKHTDLVKELLSANDSDVSKEHCKGMEGLVAEAKKHIFDEGPDSDELLDAIIIAQYQRMTHYGITGFGTAAAYAEALGLSDQAQQLRDAVKEIYGGDEYASTLAEVAVNLKAEEA